MLLTGERPSGKSLFLMKREPGVYLQASRGYDEGPNALLCAALPTKEGSAAPPFILHPRHRHLLH